MQTKLWLAIKDSKKKNYKIFLPEVSCKPIAYVVQTILVLERERRKELLPSFSSSFTTERRRTTVGVIAFQGEV